MRERVLNAIYKKLEEEPENENLQRQITLLNKASISTIDSFCLEIVKNYFYELDNISPNFRIADTTEIELLKQEIIEEIFEKKYEEQDESFLKLINIYTSYRDDTPLKELILKIYTYIQSNPFPKKWLEEKIELFNIGERLQEDFSKTIWGEELIKELNEELIDDISTLKNIEKKLLLDTELEKIWQTIRNDIDMLETLQCNLDNWNKAFEISQNMKFVTWPRQKIESDIKEQAKEIRTQVKAKLNKKINKIMICNSQEANKDIYDMYDILKKLQNLILEFDEIFSKKKREKNIVDFNDIEHFALKILLKEDENGNLKQTEVTKKYQEKFQEIAIDEYQDSNLVQEYILTAISNEKNIFMVGDVKQSIYKFRQAMPELFLQKYESYEKNQESRENIDVNSDKTNPNSQTNLSLLAQNCQTNPSPMAIQLFKNFRSRKNILDFTNMIFENIMSRELGDIDYNQDEYLNLGANYEDTNQDLKTEIYVLNLKENDVDENNYTKEYVNDKNSSSSEIYEYESEETEEEQEKEEDRIENIELEARFVANKIKSLINDKFQVFDIKKKEFRNISYKDIVILLRSTKETAPIYEQELINLDIPVFSDSSQEYLDSIEIQTMMNLLKIIDNPMQDIPLVAILRSSIGGFTDDELVRIRLSDKYDNFYTCLQKAKVDVDEKLKNKIENFLNNLDCWREEQEFLALDELIWKIYSDTGYYNYVGLMPNGFLRQANLKMLFERAKQYETASFKGLYNFIHFIEKLRLNSGDMSSAKLIGENDDVVRIMSIHKSKGLEFPVVFLSCTGKQFNLMDLNKNVLLHQNMGIGVKYIDYERQVQYDTLSKVAIKSRILTESLSEEMRILYVALTRAKEKLIITGVSKDFEKEMKKMQEEVYQYKKIDNKINPILLKKYKRYLDWILLTYCYEKPEVDNIVLLIPKNKKDIMKSFEKVEKEEIDVMQILKNTKVEEKELNYLKDKIEWKYSFEVDTKIPTKTSVTNIKQMKTQIHSLKEIGEMNLAEMKNENDNNFVKKEFDFPAPQFLRTDKNEKLSGAQKGTLIHLCMQRLNVNIDYDLSKVNELIKDLQERQIITRKEAENINAFKVLKFTKSHIWKELKNSKKIWREQPFYINIPVNEIYEEKSDENILVQGIIDLYYINENDELILVDYKTDYIEEERQLVERYNTQLDLYRRALEQALDKKVAKTYIYSTCLEKEILL